MNCPSCDSENSAGRKFCGECGGKLAPKAAVVAAGRDEGACLAPLTETSGLPYGEVRGREHKRPSANVVDKRVASATPANLRALRQQLQLILSVRLLPDIHDYEALLGRGHSAYITMLWHGVPINGLDDAAMPPGFTGSAALPRAGRARFVSDEPERFVIDVDAPAAGFLVLADQYDSGWRAIVNGTAVPMQRANPMFRLVEVPAGRSRVEFRYRPRSGGRKLAG